MTPNPCDLEHARAVPARIRVRVASTRLGRAGRPLVRDLKVCSAHAAALRRLGVEVVKP